MKKLTKKEHDRLEELEDKALDAFKESSDYIPAEWLDEEEAKEWQKLMNKWLNE
jgi:hypothetical protein